MSEPKGINGGWLIIIKICLCTYPLVLVWGGWLTVETVANRQFRLTGPRFTPLDAKELELKWRAELASEVKALVMTISSLPPVDWRQRIEKLEAVATAS